ncbi:MAG: hypothetical protein KF773_41035 [Deltaproteobacteria bacterium]|nr:hypothetical protein [Deltaproteobacteria bacterium]
MKRVIVIAVLAVCAGGGTAEARRGRGAIVVINTGNDVMHVREPTATEKQELISDTSIGYKYDLFGLFWLDVWRSSGQWVQYNGEGYLELSDEQVARMKLRVPWGYFLPPGLWLILLGIEFLIARALRPTARSTLILTGALGVVAIVFLVEGSMMIQAASTGFVALVHGLAALRAMRAHPPDEDREVAAPSEPTPRRAPIEPPPRIDDDPFRAPPTPPPVLVHTTPEPPKATPIVHDENAAPPSFLK